MSIPLFRAFSAAGAPLAGGLLYTYAANSTTPKATYTDYALSIPNTNPVVLDSTGSAVVRLATGGYKLVLTDASAVQQWTIDYVFDNTPLSQSQIATVLIPQTSNEALANSGAGVTPVNYQYPEGCVDRYGTNTSPGTTDMTPAIRDAVSVCQISGGVVTFLQAIYLVTGTISITGPASMDGGASAVNYSGSGSAGGAILYAPTLNAAILSYGAGSRFVKLSNIIIQGSVIGGTTSQDGILIGTGVGSGAHGIRMTNVAVFNAGRYGINVVNSVSGDYRSLYISGCGTDGILINNSGGGAVGANRWYNINVTTSGSADIDINNTGGGIDSWYGVTVENGTYGFVFESGVTDQKVYGLHSEGHATQSVWFKSGSNRNLVWAETVGSSEPLPANAGGAQNAVMGTLVSGGSVVATGKPTSVQRVSTTTLTNVNGAGLSAMATGSTPTTGEGLLALTQAITPSCPGSVLTVRAEGMASAHFGGTSGTLFAALFQGSTCIGARSWPSVATDVPYMVKIEADVAAGSIGTAETFTLRIGSSAGGDTVTFGGAAAGNLYGGTINTGQLTIEEYAPSSG